MARIYYYVHGRGRGHASRTLPITASLAEEHEVHVLTGGQAADLLEGNRAFTRIEPVYPGWRGARTTGLRVLEDLRRQRRDRPDLVLSDGDMPGLIAARLLGIRTISIGHDLVFSRCHLPPKIPRMPLAAQLVNGWSAHYLGMYGIAVHFLPIEAKTPRTVVARPWFEAELQPAETSEPFVLTYFRDRNGRAVAERVVRAGYRVVSFADEALVGPRITTRPFDRADFRDHLRRCRGVVASAGSNLLAECIHLGKPILALYRPHDNEQRINSLLAERAGVAQSACLTHLRESELSRFLERMDQQAFRRLALDLPDTVEAMNLTVDRALAS